MTKKEMILYNILYDIKISLEEYSINLRDIGLFKPAEIIGRIAEYAKDGISILQNNPPIIEKYKKLMETVPEDGTVHSE